MGLSLWFKMDKLQIEFDQFIILNISTHLQQRVFRVEVINESNQILLQIFQGSGDANLRFDYESNQWVLLVVTVQKEIFMQIFSFQNDEYQQKKLNANIQEDIELSQLNLSSNNHQCIQQKDLFFYFSSGVSLINMQSYIANTAFLRTNCIMINEQNMLNKEKVITQFCKACGDQDVKIDYRQIIKQVQVLIYTFYLNDYEQILQNKRNFLFRLNGMMDLFIQNNNNSLHLTFQFIDIEYYLGVIENKQEQITVQIYYENNYEQNVIISYFVNQFLKNEIKLKRNIKYLINLQNQITEYLQENTFIKDLYIYINMKILQKMNQGLNGCLLQAKSIFYEIESMYTCIFYSTEYDKKLIFEFPRENNKMRRLVVSVKFVHTERMRSIVRNTYQNSWRKDTVSSIPVFIFGYFKLTQTVSLPLPLITVGSLKDNYNFLNFYILSNTLVQTKYVHNTNNVIKTQDTSVDNFQNKWMGFGLRFRSGYATTYYINDTLFMLTNGVTMTITYPAITTYDICITCKFDGGIFGHFDGYVSSVKMIWNYNPNYETYYNLVCEDKIDFQSPILNNSFNINNYKLNSEYLQISPFDCSPNYVFFEGVCVDDSFCQNLSFISDPYESFEVGKYKSTTLRCLDCQQSNCLQCSESACTTCRPSYKLVSGSCIRCDDQNSCMSSCSNPQIFDPMNQICVTSFNMTSHILTSPLLSTRIFLENFDITVTPTLPILNQIVLCYFDVDVNRYTLHSFLGGPNFTSSTLIKKKWIQIPKGYKKSVSFYVLFYGSGNPSNLQVKINSNVAQLENNYSTFTLNKISCSGSGSTTQSIFKVKFSIMDYLNYFDLEIKSNSNNWGIRHLNIEIFKCHPTCDSCKLGPQDCTTCNIAQQINRFQCTCPSNQYAQYQNCFDSPCVVCQACQIANCVQCEEITGKCLKCDINYVVKDGLCISESSCQDMDAVFQNYCIISKDKGFTHFPSNQVVQYGDYWKFQNNTVASITCLTKKCLPIITMNEFHSLQITLPNYQIYHFKLNVTIDIYTYQSLESNDIIQIKDGSTEVFSQSYTSQKALQSGAPNNNVFFTESFSYLKYNDQLYFQFISKCDEFSDNEGYSFSQIVFIYERCNPLCKQCTSTLSSCFGCIDNAAFVNGSCQCNDGFYFSYDRLSSISTPSGKCLQCNPACLTCIGKSYRECIQCSEGYSNLNGVCQYNCIDGQYWDATQQSCLNCHACCRTCENGNNFTCHDCLQDYTFRVSDKSCFIYNGQCSLCTVAVNFLCGGTLDNHNDCILNDWVVISEKICANCSKFVNNKCGGDQDQIVTDKCAQYGYFNYDLNNCTTCRYSISNSCGKNFVKDYCYNYGWDKYDSKICKNCNVNSLTFNECLCDTSCSTCSRYFTPNACTSCFSNRYLYDNRCLTKCPNGYRISEQKCIFCLDQEMPNCQSCYPTCLICNPFQINSNSNLCTECSTLTRYLDNGECKCIDPEDSREMFFECSYKQIAVLKATLSNTDSVLTIEFGKQLTIPNTFQQNVFSQAFCQYLFTSQTLILIGSTSECSISNQSIIVNLEYSSQLFNGDLIYFKQNILSFYTSPSIMIQKYMNNIVVQIQVIGKSEVIFAYSSHENACNDIKISHTKNINAANRGFYQVKWLILSYQPLNSEYQQVLNDIFLNASSQKKENILIPKGITFPNLQLKIQLIYTLSANVNGQIEFFIEVESGKKIFLQLKTSIPPTFYRYQSGSIEIETLTKICLQGRDLVFIEPLNFTIISNEIQELNYHNSTYQQQFYQFELKPYTYQPKKINIDVIAQLASEQDVESQIKYSFEMIQSKLYIKILCPNGQFNYKKKIIIGSKIRDFDIENETDPQDIDLSWKCMSLITQNTCVDSDGNEIFLTQNQSVISFDGFTFTPYTAIQLILTGKKPVDRLTADSSTLLLSELDIPPLDVQLFKTFPKYDTINLNEEMYITLNYSSSVNVDLLSFTGTIEYENVVVGIIKFDYNVLRFQIWNYFNDIQKENNEVQIRFSVFNPVYYMPSIFKSTLLINFPPSDCILNATPTIGGFSIETKYLISFTGCKDQDEPIQYQFFYYTTTDDFNYEKKNPLQVKRRQISDKQSSVLIETILPQGKLLLLAQSIDKKLAIYNSTIQIDVQFKQYDEQGYLSIIQQQLDNIEKIPISDSILQLSIICDDLLQRPELKGTLNLNKKKIEIISQLQNLSQQISPLSTFSTVADKAIISLIQSGVTFNSSEKEDLLIKLKQKLNTLSNLQEQNLEISQEKLKQNQYDSFSIINALGNHEDSSNSIIDFSEKIGNSIFNNILPNEDPVFYQGSQLNILSSQITEKNLCLYFTCDQDYQPSEVKQSSIYNFKKTEFQENPYSQDSSFLNYTNQLKQLNNTKNISNYPVISPSIRTQSNMQVGQLTKQAVLNFQSKESASNQKKLICLTKQVTDNSWTKSGCYSVYNKKQNTYQCICDDLSPTTIIDDLEDLLSNNNLNEAFSSDGISNLANFNDFYNYVAFWFISLQTLSFITFYFIGSFLDNIDIKQRKNQQSAVSDCSSVKQSVKSTTKKNQVVPLNQKQLDQNLNLKRQEVNHEIILIDDLNTNFSPKISIAESIDLNQQKDCADLLDLNKSQLSQQVTQILSPNKRDSKSNPSSKSIFSTNGMFQKKKFNKFDIIKEGILADALTQNTNLSTSPQQKTEEFIQNKNERKNQFLKKISNFKNISFLKQVLIFHNFFGIFYLFNGSVPRSIRFLIFYVRSIHSLAISVIFDKDYSTIQQIILAIINAISVIIIIKLLSIFLSFKSLLGKIINRFFTVTIILGYYYIVFSIVSGQSSSESNKFIGTFAIFYFGDILVVSLISALLQRFIANFLLKKQRTVGIQNILYKLMELQLILLQTDFE